jgi:hypothetical protein
VAVPWWAEGRDCDALVACVRGTGQAPGEVGLAEQPSGPVTPFGSSARATRVFHSASRPSGALLLPSAGGKLTLLPSVIAGRACRAAGWIRLFETAWMPPGFTLPGDRSFESAADA